MSLNQLVDCVFSFKFLTVPVSCGGALTANRSVQQFASPGWPAGYGSGLDCTWVITAPPGEKIELRFLPRSLLQRPDPDKSCKSDSVIIYDGGCICVSGTQMSVPFVESMRLNLHVAQCYIFY